MINNVDFQYQNLIKNSFTGYKYESRMGITCYSTFAPNPIITNRFPIISLRKQFWKSIVIELIWLLRGHSSLEFLQKHGVNFWNDWANEDNSLGRAYPPQFRDLQSPFTGSVDQFGEVLNQVGKRSTSRRLLVDIWNGAELSEMTIHPCCFAHQVRIVDDRVHMFVFQRSCDILIGLPQNLATYGLLHRIYSKISGLETGNYHHIISDAHVYANGIESARKILDFDVSDFSTVPYVTISDNLDSPSAFLEFLDDSEFMSTEEIMKLFGLHNYNPADYFKIPVNV